MNGSWEKLHLEGFHHQGCNYTHNKKTAGETMAWEQLRGAFSRASQVGFFLDGAQDGDKIQTMGAPPAGLHAISWYSRFPPHHGDGIRT